MGKGIFAFVIAFAFVAVAVPTDAVLVPHTLDTPGTNKILMLPEQAGNSPVVSLGTAVDPASGKLVEGFAIIHPKKGYHHRPGHGGGPGGPGNGEAGSSCFAYLSNGAKWKTVEDWVVNFANNSGLSADFVLDTLTSSVVQWEDAADGVVNGAQGADILGNGELTDVELVADTSSPDGVNEVYFADISNSGAIAVTIVWGIFSGPPFARELVEWDMVFDDVDFEWTEDALIEPSEMDFWNIAIHELGHAKGMGHPDDSCTEETMFRFATEGETKKRDLHSGDIAGINGLY